MASDETWAYRPEVGKWDKDRPPTRQEALMLAAECATASTDNTISPDAARARAASAAAWALIADVAPAQSFPQPLTVDGDYVWIDPVTLETYVIAPGEITPPPWRRVHVELP